MMGKLLNQRFGELVVIERVRNSRPGRAGKARWRCVCDCGIETIVFACNLTRGHTTSCGTHQKGKIKNITGSRFGKLTIVRRAASGNRRFARWLCLCDCGAETIAAGGNLRNGNTQSCGCDRIEKLRQKRTTHGLTQHPLYAIWNGMLARCFNPKTHAWKNYGGRGITVCERWLKFENFYEDVKRLYVSWLSMDRIDNNKGYEPGNVRWVDKIVQSNNRRNIKRARSDDDWSDI